MLDAVTRGQEMLMKPMIELPTLAVEFARHLCSKVGGCMEVFLTAYAVYAQIVEKLPCNDNLYQPDQDAIAWFAERGHRQLGE